MRGRDPRPRTSTFAVEGHHYALLLVDDLDACDPSRRTTSGSTASSPGLQRTDGRNLLSGLANHERRARSSSARAASATRSRRASAPSGRRTSATSGSTRSGRTRSSSSAATIEWPDAVLLLGDQVYADEVSPADARVHPSAARHGRASRRADRRLRGVHAALPRVVVRARHPLAALDRADAR